MSEKKQLKVGKIPFLNSVPYFELLTECGFDGELVEGVPAQLNGLLRIGRIDASLSSSIEYALNWQDYMVFPELSISSVGEVKSVLLFSSKDIDNLSGQTVYLTEESDTSVYLLRIILEIFLKQTNINYVVPDEPIEDFINNGETGLLIGDRALRKAKGCINDTHFYDLGELWTQATDLPFVFALWMIRKESLDLDPEAVNQFYHQLVAARKKMLNNVTDYTAKAAEARGMEVERVHEYWQTIDYRLEKAHIDGLRLFYQLCTELGVIKEKGEINFFHPWK